jgi:hypothetical protein
MIALVDTFREGKPFGKLFTYGQDDQWILRHVEFMWRYTCIRKMVNSRHYSGQANSGSIESH